MKPAPVKLDKRNTLTSKKKKKKKKKKMMVTSCQRIVTSFLFFQFLANFEQSGSWTPDT